VAPGIKEPLKIFPPEESDPGRPGIAVDPEGNRYFVSPADRTIRKVTGKGTQIGTIGGGRLTRPTQIAIHPKGHIYVIDDGILKIIRAKPKGESGAPR
jgi:hypothetical protein